MTASLITGISGIGGALAKLMLKEGHKVFVVDRDAEALKKLDDNANLVKIEADVGTDEGAKKIKAAVGDTALNFVVYAAASVANQDNRGAPIGSITRENFQDMIQTSVYGKVFTTQLLSENLKKAGPTKKARVFNVGVPFGDGPMPNGKYMCVPGWIGLGAAKAAAKYVWEGMKVECADVALFGYGHPGLTKTSITTGVYDNWAKDMMISQMVTKRFEGKDFMTPDEPAALFWNVLTKTSDEDFQNVTWAINKMCAEFPDVKVTQTSDVAGGIKLPEPAAAASPAKQAEPVAATNTAKIITN